MHLKLHPLFLGFILVSLSACTGGQEAREDAAQEIVAYPTAGEIERFSPRLDSIVAPDARPEVLASGFDWSEGPLWLPEQDLLIFSDVPLNRIYRWREGDTVATVYLEPSGMTGDSSQSREPGSNGLTLDPQGRLVLCQHGDRRMARMEAPLDNPRPEFATLAAEYEGRRFNSPNDACYDSRGNLYFTDPPYGLPGGADSPEKELPFHGVYKLTPAGEITLLDTLSRPNGIALSPDETRLYVAVSDPDRAVWMVYDLDPAGGITNGRVFYDATGRKDEGKGVPDGMKVSRNGVVFGTGPGGVWVISPEGEPLGIIKTGQATANCAFNETEDMLYITADSLLLRVRLVGQ